MASFFSQIQLNKILSKTPVYKGDAEQIEDYLLSNGIDCLYHYTDRSNLDSIRQYGLFSSLTCQRLNINNKPGGNTLSHKLDLDHHLDDFVRLSFVGRLPMAERLLLEGYDLVMLKVSIKVTGFLQTFYTDRNATEKEVKLGSDFAFVKSINEPKGYYEPYKLQQSEVLVRTHVPKEFILNLDNLITLR